MKKFLILVLLLAAPSVFATSPEYIAWTPYPRMELALGGGLDFQSGYLTRQDSVAGYDVSLNLGLPTGIFAFSFQGFNADHDTSEFALGNNKLVKVMAFSFIPYVTLCTRGNLSVLGGLGLTQVGLYQTSPEYNFNFGTYTLSAWWRYQLSPQWSLQYKTSWFAVTQIANDQKTTFEVWSHTVAAGYSFF
jgi:hypothetical protein